MYGVDDGDAFTAHVEPGEAPALVAWLDWTRFMMCVEVHDVTDELAVTWRRASRVVDVPYSGYSFIARADLMLAATPDEDDGVTLAADEAA